MTLFCRLTVQVYCFCQIGGSALPEIILAHPALDSWLPSFFGILFRSLRCFAEPFCSLGCICRKSKTRVKAPCKFELGPDFTLLSRFHPPPHGFLRILLNSPAIGVTAPDTELSFSIFLFGCFEDPVEGLVNILGQPPTDLITVRKGLLPVNVTLRSSFTEPTYCLIGKQKSRGPRDYGTKAKG